MAQYIDRSAVVAEIDRIQDTTMDEDKNFLSPYHEGIFDGLTKIENFLNTLNEGIMAENKENDERKAQIAEMNRHISDGIEQWADICLESEAKEWAYMLNYTPKDLMNATYIFQHIMSNIGIKTGIINEEKAVELGDMLRKLIIVGTGIDPHKVKLNENN